MSAVLVLSGVLVLVAYGIWLMVTEGRDKKRVLSSLEGDAITVGLARGAYASGSVPCRGRITLDGSQRRVTFFEEDPKFQKGPLGLRNPAPGEVLRLGQIRWVADSTGRIVGGPWTRCRGGSENAPPREDTREVDG